MRSSLLPGLLRAARYNLARQQSKLSLFETGLRFLGEDADQQPSTIAGLVLGPQYVENWQHNRAVDFYSLKSDVEALCSHLSGKLEFVAADLPGMHPGQCAQIVFNKRPVGVLAQLHPACAQYFEIDQAVFVFELDSSVLERRSKRRVSVLSKFPSVRRDLSLILPLATPIDAVVTAVNKSKANSLIDVIVFDQYVGEAVPAGYKTVAIGVVFQSNETTLDDDQVDAAVEKILEHLNKACEARLRH